MLNKLYVGFTKTVELPKGGCLLIDDEVRKVPEWRRPRTFDPLKHSFNPLEDLDYRKASSIVEVFDAAFPPGESTLTKDTGLDFLAECLDERPPSLETLIPRPDKKSPPGHLWAYSKVRRILRSPVLRSVLCSKTKSFNFKRGSVNQARLNRAELGDFDALVLGLFLMAHFNQLVVPDLGFYGRDAHVSLIREGRLIAGVNTLGELSPHLRRSVLLMKNKVACGTTVEDAETLAAYARLQRGTNGFNEFVQDAIA